MNNSTTTDDEDNATCSVVHTDSFTPENNRPASPHNDTDHKRMAKKEKHVSRKHQLKEKMEQTREQLNKEINKHDQQVELTEYRDELDSRFQECMDYEKEVEEIEQYLDRRQELCNSKEEDLRLLDDQLDILRQELKLDKERLQKAGLDISTIETRFRKKPEKDLDDTALKANLDGCQNDLKKAGQTIHKRDAELTQAKQQISSLQSENDKHKEKIKQLETQLSMTLRQLINDPTKDTHSPPNRMPQRRHSSVRPHVDPFKSPADLSINQQGQLNRLLSGKDPNNNSSLTGRKTCRSFSVPAKNPLDLLVRPQVRSDGKRSSFDASDGGANAAPLEFVRRPRSLTEGSTSLRSATASSVCAIM